VLSLVHNKETPIIDALLVVEVCPPFICPVTNFVEIATRVKRVSLQDNLVTNLHPFHWRQISMALYRLTYMIYAVSFASSAKLQG
jgi:hypothetical protein